jgi:surface carbohydrate biosynthesis protein
MRSPIAIFDESGSNYVKTMVLWDCNVVILPVIQRTLYLTPQIIWGMVRNFHTIYRVSANTGKFYLSVLYYLSCLDLINPAAVVTWIDSNSDFQILDRICKTRSFFAIQNGTRPDWMLKPPYLPNEPDVRSRIYHSNFFCFGEAEVEAYRHYGHEVDRYHVVGSVMGSWYFARIREKELALKYDVCLISQWVPYIMVEASPDPALKQANTFLDDFLARYIREYKLRIAVAMRSEEESEYQHFLQQYGVNAVIVRNDKTSFSSLRTLDQSSVGITFTSTAGREALGWGKKILFCNFSGDPGNDLAIDGPWFLSEPNYELFKNKMDYLRAVEDDEYNSMTKVVREKIMKYTTPVPAYQHIRDTILAAAE